MDREIVLPVLLFLLWLTGLLTALDLRRSYAAGSHKECSSRTNGTSIFGLQDLYGPGILGGIFIQAITSVIASSIRRNHAKDIMISLLPFSLALVVALYVMMFEDQCLFVVDVVIVTQLLHGGIYQFIALYFWRLVMRVRSLTIPPRPAQSPAQPQPQVLDNQQRNAVTSPGAETIGEPEGNTTYQPIVRTVTRAIREGFTGSSEFVTNLSPKQYEEYQEGVVGAAIEMRKVVRVIPPRGSQGVSSSSSLSTGGIIDRIESERMIIRSPELLIEVKRAVKYWPSSAYYDGQKKLALDSPFRSIGVHRNALGDQLERLKKTPHPSDIQKKTIRELEILLQEVDKKQEANVALENQRHATTPATVTFDMLWMLFRPGSEIFVRFHGVRVSARVKLCVWDRGRLDSSIDDPYTQCQVHFWYLDHNGTVITRRGDCTVIDRFSGEKCIADLPVYPQKYAADYIAEKERRIKVGDDFVKLIKNGYCHRHYSGFLSKHAANPYIPEDHSYYEGRVIIDPGQYTQEHGAVKGIKWEPQTDSGLSEEIRTFVDLNPTDPTTIFTNEHLLLLPEWIRGFTIGTRGPREWVWLNISHLKEITKQADLLKTLAIQPSDLNVIKALAFNDQIGCRPVRESSTSRTFSADFIKGKGESRAVLLHGAPGLGKTYTVECVAEWSERPLLRLTCAELGLNAKHLEDSLYKYLRRAEKWHAVVLIDEADIYLRSRAYHPSFEQEGVVSVFLRALEYYAGILFLTTNRAPSLDMAVLNRMALIVQYELPTLEQRKQIVENCLENLHQEKRFDSGRGMEYKYCALMDRDEDNWNGREITTILKLASLQAECDHGNAKNPPSAKALITNEHIEQAANIIRRLKKYQFQIHGVKTHADLMRGTGYV